MSKFKQNIVLIFVSIVFSLALAEIILRIVWTNPHANAASNKVVELRLQPPSMHRYVDRSRWEPNKPTILFRTNTRRYIEPSNQFKNPDYTVAFLGGSTTVCAFVSEEKRFPALVSTYLESKGIKVNTLNAARSGNTLHDSINVLLNHVILDKPDFVIVMHATNDRGVLSKDKKYISRMGANVTIKDLSKWLLQQFSIHSSIGGLLREFWIKIQKHGPFHLKVTQGIETEEYRKRLNAIINIAKSFGSKPILMTQPLAKIKTNLTPAWYNSSDQEVFNEIIKEVAKENAVPVIDLVQFMTTRIEDFYSNPASYLYDGMHVTDLGSTKYAEHIAERLIEIMLH